MAGYASSAKLAARPREGTVMSQLELSPSEIQFLLQSLDHCLATCHNKAKTGAAACSDCEAAKALRKRLEAQLAA